MTSYILRDIDPQLWAKVKAKANQEGHTVRWVMLQLLTLWIGTPNAEQYGNIYDNARKHYAKER